MNILEHQAKVLLQNNGITVPKGVLVQSLEQAAEVASDTANKDWMVKAQIRAGGRRLGSLPDGRGGVRKAMSKDEIVKHTEAMLGAMLTTQQTPPGGLPVNSVYIEELVSVDKEFAVSICIDERRKCIVLILTDHGGSEIEFNKENDIPMHTIDVSFRGEVDENVLMDCFRSMGLSKKDESGLRTVINKLIDVFIRHDASLLEVNPLGFSNGKWVALDAKIAFDKNALFRQPEIFAIDQEPGTLGDNRQASMDGFNYFAMHGDVASIAVGAGLAMATLDAISYCGGKPANFLDLPPDSRVNRVVTALELVMANPKTKCVLINVFGGGIMRCDTVSDAITLLHKSEQIQIPLIVRLAGTNADLAIRRLQETMPHIKLATNLAEAAQMAAEAAQGAPVDEKQTAKSSLLSKVREVFNVPK